MNEKKGVRYETSERYIETTKEALNKIVISPPERSYLRRMANDFLDMAYHLLENDYKDASAVMIGSVLEEHLRQLCNKFGFLFG